MAVGAGVRVPAGAVGAVGPEGVQAVKGQIRLKALKMAREIRIRTCYFKPLGKETGAEECSASPGGMSRGSRLVSSADFYLGQALHGFLHLLFRVVIAFELTLEIGIIGGQVKVPVAGQVESDDLALARLARS